MIDDWELIVASFQAEYGLRLSKELHGMSWKEFAILLNGLGPNTPLVKVVSIRSENDPKVVREMTKEQKQIRNAWRRRQFEKKPPQDQEEMMANLQKAIRGMVGL